MESPSPPPEKKRKLSSADQCLISSPTIGENQQQSSGLLVTAFGKQKKMNDRILRKIWICSDVWMDIFPFLDHAQLGLKMALLSPRFDVLVDKHFDGKSELTIWRLIFIRKGTGVEKPALYVYVYDGCERLVPYPLPEYPLPNKIRFKLLDINYIDHSVIAFLRANPRVFGKFTHFSISTSSDIDNTPIWDVLRQTWPIFGPNIHYLCLSTDADHLDNFVRLISPTIFSDFARLDSIHSGMFPDQLADDGPTATAGQVLSKWLHIPTTDGRPKRLRSLNYCCSASPGRNFEWINNFKEVFLRATTSVSYHITFALIPFAVSNVSQPNEQFELVNERTKEKLTLLKEDDFGYISWWTMERCPIIGETAAVQQQQHEDEHLYCVNIVLSEDCIGPLCPPVKLSGSELII